MDQSAQLIRKRPKFVWAILIYNIFIAAFALFAIYMFYTNKVPMTAEEAAYVETLSPIRTIIPLVNCILYLAGSIALFQLRRIALPIFLTAFALNIGVTLSHAPFFDIIKSLGRGESFGMLAGYLIYIAIIIYTWRLKARGVLV